MPCVHPAYLLCTQVRKDRKALPSLERKVSTLSSGHKVDTAGQQEAPQGPMEGCPGRSTHHRREGPCRVGKAAGGALSALRPAGVFGSPKGACGVFKSPKGAYAVWGSSNQPSIHLGERKHHQHHPGPAGRPTKSPAGPGGLTGQCAALVGHQGGRGGPGDPMGLT